jgi:parallel beta-helix repeat protein
VKNSMKASRVLKTFVCLLLLLPIAFAVQPVLADGNNVDNDGNDNSGNNPTCVPAGTTGLNTLLIADSSQEISGETINAAPCDVGIFVPPGSHNVVISDNNIFGAKIHGIFVQDSSRVRISENYVHDNSGGVPAVSCDFNPRPCVNEGKAIQLVGTSNSVVSENRITRDLFGGIAVTDDGAVDPGALNSGASNPANNNLIEGNKITRVSNDCGIVIAVYNPETASHNVIRENVVLGSSPPFGVNPYVGQIVVATDGPGATITHTTITDNEIVGSTLPGIVVHSNAPGDKITDTKIRDNTLGNNGYYPPFFSSPNTPVAANGPTGISLVAEAYPGMPTPPSIYGTTLSDNKISPDTIGVWLCKTTGTTIHDTPDEGSSVTSAVVTCSAGGS